MKEATQGGQAFGRFTSAIGRNKKVFVEAMLATTVANLLALAASLYSMQVYDRVIPNNSLSTLWVLTIGAILAIGFEVLLKHARAEIVDRACKSIDLELSDGFFGRAIGIRMDRRPPTIGTFAAQIRLFESVRAFLTSTTLFILTDVPFAIFFIAVIASLAGPVALVPLLLLPLSIGTGLVFARPIGRLAQRTTTESMLKNGLLIESIDAIETIKALGAEKSFTGRWHGLTERIAEDELKIRSLSGLSTHLTHAIQSLAYVGLVAAGVMVITTGQLTMGGLIACSIISGRALGPIAQISGLLVQWQHTRTALKGLDAIINSPVDGEQAEGMRTVKPQTCRGELRLESVRFAYDGKLAVLEIDALTIQPGERVAVLGSIGSGKSTLVKLLSGLYQPTSGRVFLDGVDMTQLEPAHLREHMHYLPQDARLFNGSLRDNLVIGGDDPGDDALLAAARATGLDRVVAQHPRGLSLGISEGGQGLSGGQRQITSLTRLLLRPRQVLLIDEPTASIDGPLEEQVANALFASLGESGVAVVVTHKTNILKFMTRIIVMDRGKIVADGPRDAVLAKLSGRPQAAPQRAVVEVAA